MSASARVCEISLLRSLAVVAAAALALALLPLASAGAQQQPDPDDACPDDPPEHPYTDRDTIPEVHLRNVDCVTDRGIALGFEDGSYRPFVAVPRNQMASFVARTLDEAGFDLPGPEQHPGFVDTIDDHHEDNIRRLAAAGIVQGGPEELPPTHYGPLREVRRDQMASFLIRASEWAFDDEFGSDDQQFEDVGSDNVHFENVNAAAEFGLAQGGPQELPPTHYGPDRSSSRAHMASFLARLLTFLETFDPDEPDDETPDETPGETPETFTAAPALIAAEHAATVDGDVDVRYVFDDDVDVIFDVASGDEFDPTDAGHELGFHLHTGGGENVFGDAAAVEEDRSNAVIVRFVDFADDLDDVVTAAVDADSVGSEDAEEDVLTNPEGAVPFEEGGDTAAPVLVSVTVEEDEAEGERTVTFTFDTGLDDAEVIDEVDFAVYDEDGERTPLTDCDYAEDDPTQVVCSTEEGFLIPDEEFEAVGDAVLAGVASDTVATDDPPQDTDPRNHAASAPV